MTDSVENPHATLEAQLACFPDLAHLSAAIDEYVLADEQNHAEFVAELAQRPTATSGNMLRTANDIQTRINWWKNHLSQPQDRSACFEKIRALIQKGYALIPSVTGIENDIMSMFGNDPDTVGYLGKFIESIGHREKVYSLYHLGQKMTALASAARLTPGNPGDTR